MNTTEESERLWPFSGNQYRMCRLQVLNWGTFSDLHDIAISQKGFLITGRSGSGKSTLLDAIAALLVPPRWTDFNAAAREGDRSHRDRNLLSYVRGAWSEQKDNDSGMIATQFLRTGTTRSALALSYNNGFGRCVTLVSVLWIRGTSNSNSDVKRQYMIFERDFDLNELEGFDLDVRKLKQDFGNEAFIVDEFRPYSERFRRLLGVESEMALRLLQRAQSAKNLGDLNLFLREFMLDPPDTFAAAERLVDEFEELDGAHQAVLTARKQIQTLKPAQDRYQEHEKCRQQRTLLAEIETTLEGYCELLRCRLLRETKAELQLKLKQLDAVLVQKDSQLLSLKSELSTLEHRHRDIGGNIIEQLELEQSRLEQSKTDKLAKLKHVQDACNVLGWAVPNSPETLAQAAEKARNCIEEWQNKGDEEQSRLFDLRTRLKEIQQKLDACLAELDALRRHPSNIPSPMLRLRKQVAAAIGVHEDALPFAGELIDVHNDQALWRGAIERVLHTLALSILVEERHYNALTQYVNSTNLDARLVYYRTGAGTAQVHKSVSLNALAEKINFKGSVHTPWLENELRTRYDFDCVGSVQALRSSQRPAITVEGLIKSGKSRHEKDDRKPINDPRFWVLGFDNREKLALYEKEEKELVAELNVLTKEIQSIDEANKQRSAAALRWQTMANLQWQEIDVGAILQQIDAVTKQLKDIRRKDSNLEKLSQQIADQKVKISKAEKSIQELKVTEQRHNQDHQQYDEQLHTTEAVWGNFEVPAQHKTELDRRFELLEEEPKLTTLDKLSRHIDKSFSNDTALLSDKIAACKQIVEAAFADFKRQWAAESANMDTTVESAADYFQLLLRLENDNLPAYEDRFFELLQNQSNQNLAALSTHLSQARKTIYERMELVNESLGRAQFNPNSYLRINTVDRQLPEVREFKQEIYEALSHAWAADREESEKRFGIIRDIVRRFSSQETADKRWRDTVLDVRQHVEFIGQEVDSEGREIETYRSGAGKSGGQRQKLATTCLAAALHYQLSRNEEGIPAYAAVVLDEAFDKADNEFTTLAMNIFAQFGFQMIVATPLKSVMTLEPFIGGACFVDIKDRRHSTQLPIRYDSQLQRLKLSDAVGYDVESTAVVS